MAECACGDIAPARPLDLPHAMPFTNATSAAHIGRKRFATFYQYRSVSWPAWVSISTKQKAVERFRADVVEPSMTKLVILDFWAEWCGPCKALTPMLEKVAADYAEKGVVLAKVNVDEEQFIASQFQVQSIPTVYAMYQGAAGRRSDAGTQRKPVSRDAGSDIGTGENRSRCRCAADRRNPTSDNSSPWRNRCWPMAMRNARRRFSPRSSQMAPDNAAAQGGLIRALTAAGRIDEAKSVLDAVPEPHRGRSAGRAGRTGAGTGGKRSRTMAS